MKLDFNKFQTRLITLLVFSSTIPVLGISFYSLTTTTDILQKSTINQVNQNTQQSAKKIKLFIDTYKNEPIFLSQTPPVQGIIKALENQEIDRLNPQEISDYQTWVRRLEKIFISRIKTQPYYMKIRYIDQQGMELVRVDYDGNKVSVIPKEKLQNKSDRPYIQAALKLPEGQTYIEEISLNTEQGKIEIPYKPTLRFATPIFSSDDKKVKGVIITNIIAQAIINLAKEANTITATKTFIIDEHGHYIYNPEDPSKEWGYELNSGAELSKDYPSDIAQQILSNKDGLIENYKENIISYHPVWLNQKQNRYIVIFSKTPRNIVFAPIDQFRTISFLVVIISLSIVLIIGFLILKNLVQLLKKTITQLSSFSQELITTISSQDQNINQQISSVNQTSTLIQQLEQSSQQTANQAQSVATNTKQVLQLATNGVDQVQATLNDIHHLQQQIEEIAQQSLQLGDKTNQIGNISTLANLVDDLANQTNMLALNAALEAIRVGENGQGFTVVAIEIRKLSEQSRHAAQRINAIIPQLQKTINQTLQATTQGQKTVAALIDTAQNTVDKFSQVNEAINHIVISNQQISHNSKQQANAITQVVTTINQINQASIEVASGIQITQQGIGQLNQTTQELQNII